jgi:tetratricopeptide (TPR) repeat protein
MYKPSILLEMASPEEMLVLLEAAQVYYARGEYAKAEKVFLGALVLSPDNAEVLSAIGSCLQAQGKLDEALEYYEASLSDCPHDLGAMLGRAELLLGMGKTDRAIEELESLLAQIYPDNIVAERAEALMQAAKEMQAKASAQQDTTQ